MTTPDAKWHADPKLWLIIFTTIFSVGVAWGSLWMKVDGVEYRVSMLERYSGVVTSQETTHLISK